MAHRLKHQEAKQSDVKRSITSADTYANAILRTLSSFKPPTPPPNSFYNRRHHHYSYPHSQTISQSVINELPNGSSVNHQLFEDRSSLSSSSSSLFDSTTSPSTSSPVDISGNYFTIEAHLPIVKNRVEQLEKFKRLLSRLDNIYNNNSNQIMSTTTLTPHPSSHVTDRYLFRSLSNDDRSSRLSPSAATKARKTKLNDRSNTNNPTLSDTPPELRKRYKFASVPADQNNDDIYKFPNGHHEQRSHSTDSSRYYFPPDVSNKAQELTFIRSGSGSEQHVVTFIDGASATNEKNSTLPPKSIQKAIRMRDKPYLFTKTTESHPHPSTTSSANPEDLWLQQRQRPQTIFDTNTDASPNSHLKRPRQSSVSPERRQMSKHSPTRIDTVTSTNGSLSTLRQSPTNKSQNVRFEPLSTQRSYLSEARERLAGKKRGRSPQSFQKSVDRLVSKANEKLGQHQIQSPKVPFQQTPDDYVSQYYANEENEPPIDYSMDTDDDEQLKHSAPYNRGLNTNRTHGNIMKIVNKSLIDRNYLSDANRLKQLDHIVHRYLRFIEHQSLQRELNHELIRCFSSSYIDDLRREENRHSYLRSSTRSYTYEDVQDIHMSPILEAYKMKRAMNKEKHLRSSASFDGQILSSTPTSSIMAGRYSPLFSSLSPAMAGSLNENIDGRSAGFEVDRRSHTSASITPTNLRSDQRAPGQNLDLFYEIIQDKFRGVDESIAGHVSKASEYKKNYIRHQNIATSQMESANHDNEVDIHSNSSFWSDEDDEQMAVDNQQKTIPNQKQISRYLSTVNRSLLDRPSNLIADFYISQLNRNMQESVRHVETIARDKARLRQNRNREFIEEPQNKLGRSLSAEHLYQVRKEHLRYKQANTTPTSFTVEDVTDIYKPFVLENYKRKIAIELERRRRERQGQRTPGITSPPMYSSENDLNEAVKASHPPSIKFRPNDRQNHLSHLTQSSTVRTNDTGTCSPGDDLIYLRPQKVQRKDILVTHANRTLTDDGATDVIHHVTITSPPPAYSTNRASTSKLQTRSTVSTITPLNSVHVTVVDPPDFRQRQQIYIEQKRIKGSIVQPNPDDLIDAPLTSSQQTLFIDNDRTRSISIPIEVEPASNSTRRPPAHIYTPMPETETVQVCKADRVEVESGNNKLLMANVSPVVTLNQGEIKALGSHTQHAQRLQIPPHDYDHAMIMLTPEQIQHQHNINRQPLLLAAPKIDRLKDVPDEQVTNHIEDEIRRQHTNLLTPIAEHMAKVEQDVPIFENIANANIVQPPTNKLHGTPIDNEIISSSATRRTVQPLILNASHVSRVESPTEAHLQHLNDNDYHQKRIRASDLLREVDRDPNTNLLHASNDPALIFENTTNIPTAHVPSDRTRFTEDRQKGQIHTLKQTYEPMVYDSVDRHLTNEIPRKECLSSSTVQQDTSLNNFARENPIEWGKIVPKRHYRSQENLLSETLYEQTTPLIVNPQDEIKQAQIKANHIPTLETLPRTSENTIFSYGQRNDIPLSRTSSFGSDEEFKLQTINPVRIEHDHQGLLVLDDITQPLSHHPPIQTQYYQQDVAQNIEAEPMAAREETAIENNVSFDGTFGRASFREPVRPLNAPKVLAQPNGQEALLLEELATHTTAVNSQHATRIIDNDHEQKPLINITTNHIAVIVDNSLWKGEQVKTIVDEIRPNVQSAHHKYPPNIEYQQANVILPSSILARAQYAHIEYNNEEIAQQIETRPVARDRSVEQLEVDNRMNSDNIQLSDQQILCHPIHNIQQIDGDHLSILSDDSLLLHNQQHFNENVQENLNFEKPLHPISPTTLHYPHHNYEINSSEHPSIIHPQSTTEHLYRQENVRYQEQEISPRFLAEISSAANERSFKESENFVFDFHQSPLLHENVRITTTDDANILPSSSVNQSKPVFHARQREVDPNDESYHTSTPLNISNQMNTVQANLTHTIQNVEPSPVMIDIDFRVQPVHSETSSLADMESFLNRFEDSLEPEQRLPLVDQISVTYTTSLRSNQDNTQRAIERYEKEHPFFSRSLPLEWLQPTVLPHDEQLVEQWTVEKSLETIQHQVELSTTNECASVVVVAATATDAYSVVEGFEEIESSNSINTKTTNDEQNNQQVASVALVSHCSPTSDYETDSLDKDNDTTSTAASVDAGLVVTATHVTTTTIPSQSPDSTANIPVDYLLDKLANEPNTNNELTKDFLLTIGFGQREQDMHRAKESQLEYEDYLSLLHVNENQHELLNVFFEPAHLYVPLIDEISIHHLTFPNQFPIDAPSNLSLAMMHNDDNISMNQYKTTEQQILSIAHINHQLNREENFENIFHKYEQPAYIDHYHIQPLNPFPEALYAQIDEPPVILEKEDEQSTSSILPDVILSTAAMVNEEYIEPEVKQITVTGTNQPLESATFQQFNSSFDRSERARQSTENYNLESLAEQKYVEIKISTPTPSMRIVRPSRPGTYTEDLTMNTAVHGKIPLTNIPGYTYNNNDLRYATNETNEQPEHLPSQQFPTRPMPERERARVIPSPTVSLSEISKNDEVLIRDTIVQHISEDEKSTSSEEVVFEEWSEEFRCRRIDEIDTRTNELLRSTINETSARVKSDVIKEEYKEKNERIKGHKSYDVVTEVYRRVPAHTVDPTKTTIVAVDRPHAHLYEEIPQPPPTTIPTRSLSADRHISTEHTPRDRKWSTEDIYTTEIVYDSKIARDIETSINKNQVDKNFDSINPPSSSKVYDRVRPGQYPSMPSTVHATSSTVPTSNYDRITNLTSVTTHVANQKQSETEPVVSEEYHVELQREQPNRFSSLHQHQVPVVGTRYQLDETSEEDASDQYGANLNGLTTIVSEAGSRRTSDWRNKLKEAYAPTSDDDRYEKLPKQFNGHYTAQRVTIVPTSTQQRFKEVQVKLPTRDTINVDQNKFKTSPPSRHAVKEIIVCVSRGSSPEKHLYQSTNHSHSSSDERENEYKRLVLADSTRSRDSTKEFLTTTYTIDNRPQPPKRSSSSSIVDERRALFEHQTNDVTNGLTSHKTDRPAYGRVGELRNAFEPTTHGASTREDPTNYKTTVSSSLNERRKIFEQDPVVRRPKQVSPKVVVPQRRVRRISGRRHMYLSDEFYSNERRMSETHTAPSRVTDNNESKSTTRVQGTDRLGRAGFEAIKSSLEFSMNKGTEPAPVQPNPIDTTNKDKRVISSIDSDLSRSSPPIFQSTPKSTKQNRDDDAGHESEDELSDPTTKQQEQYDSRRRKPQTRLRDFSQTTPQSFDTSYQNQQSKPSFTETNMESILSHVPTSKGKGLLIELSPHASHESPIITITKPIRDPQKSVVPTDSGIFEQSTATSHHLPTSSTSWRMNASSSMVDDTNRTPSRRDSSNYVETTVNESLRHGRRQTSDTDQTTIHGGDDSVSRSTFKYDTEIVSSDPYNQRQQRNIRRQITKSPASDYETIANYHSGAYSQRKVPITTQSRSVLPKALIVDEFETIETETHVEHKIQRTHEIKESTTKTEPTGDSFAPRKTVTTTTTTTTTTDVPNVRSSESSSDDGIRVTTPSQRFLLNERTQYYDSNKSNVSPIPIRTPPESVYTSRNESRQQTQTYRESSINKNRYDSPQSESVSYSIRTQPSNVVQEEPIRIEETWFKPIQRDRSQDSLLQNSSSRSNIRTLSTTPRKMEVTSLSPQNQVTFGKYTQDEIIAIVRVPELSNDKGVKITNQSPRTTPTIKHGISEPEIYARAKQQDEEQRAKLNYERVHATDFRPSPSNQIYQQRPSRSRIGAYNSSNEYQTALGNHTRSSSYHSNLHEQERQQPYQNPYSQSNVKDTTSRQQISRRSGSLGNLLGSGIEFEIEIEKRPPQQTKQPTVVELDQPTRAIVTTSNDGRVSIQNVAARSGNTVVINSDFHSSDRSLNRSSGYFSSDELRSQGLNTNYSSDEQSSGPGMNQNHNSQTPHTRRFRNNDQLASKLPAYYRPRSNNNNNNNNNYQQLNNNNFDKVNQIVHRYYRQSNNSNSAGFNDAIDQIEALYNNLDIQANPNNTNEPNSSQQSNNNHISTYDFSKPPSTTNRRKHLIQNTNEYVKRYSSSGFQHVPNSYDNEEINDDSTIRHLVSPPLVSTNDKRRHETYRAYSDNENLNNPQDNDHNWGSSSLNDLVRATPTRPSQSLSSSGILADYRTPGSISPNSGFGSTQNVVLQQNRLNGQSQIVQRNRASVKQVKQKSAAKKKSGSISGQYSDEDDDNDSAGGNDSPLSDSGHPQMPTRFSNNH